jgi:hypothetical protein
VPLKGLGFPDGSERHFVRFDVRLFVHVKTHHLSWLLRVCASRIISATMREHRMARSGPRLKMALGLLDRLRAARRRA